MSHEEQLQDVPKLDSIEFWYVNVKISILRAALELHVWDRIAEGTQNAEQIALKEGWDPVGTRILLDALCGMGLLAKDTKGYCLTPLSELYLVKAKSTYIGDVRIAQLTWEHEGSLADAIRKGKRPVLKSWTDPELQKVWAGHAIPCRLSPDRYMKYFEGLWPALGIEENNITVLDVACGPAMESLCLALGNPSSRITLQDWPKVLEEGARIAEKLGVGSQVTYLPGDWESVDFGKECYDVVLLGSIAHFYGPKDVETLFSKAKEALVPGGTILVSGPLPDESRCKEEFPLVSAVWLYATSKEGDMYTFSEYRDFLKKVGFETVELIKYKEATYIRGRKP